MEVRTPQTHPSLAVKLSGAAKSIFLAGSIEMGKAEPWQDELIAYLESAGTVPQDLIIFNPRRDDWDNSWKTGLNHDSNFSHQVRWELIMQEQASKKIFYFAKNTLSPITLLELGLALKEEFPLVYIDPEYLRAGNVLITANFYSAEVCTDKNSFFEAVEKYATL